MLSYLASRTWGESLETKFGTLLVAQAEEAPDLVAYAGRIVCRMS